MAIYRAVQWTVLNDDPITCVSVFWIAIGLLDRRYLDLLSRRFTSVSLLWVPVHCNIPGKCRADELARAGEFLPESFSIELGMPLASVKLDIVRKFFLDPILGQ